MRKLIKAPMTDRALSLMINKLRSMDSTAEGQIAILNQSIENSWKGIFPVKKEEPKKHNYLGLEAAYTMIDEWASQEVE